MATIIKYDATGLDGFLADCDRYIETYHGFSDPEEAASYLKDEMTSHEEVLKEYKKLTEFIDYRQSLADKAKEEKNFEKLKSLCNGKTVGLIRLREAAKTFDAVLSIYTEAEESEQKANSAKLLEMIKAPSPVKGFSTSRAVEAPPAAGCGAPPASEVDDNDEAEFDDFVEENAAMHAHMTVLDKIEEIRQTTLKLVQLNYELMCIQYNVVPKK
jgi:hypothetical protein